MNKNSFLYVIIYSTLLTALCSVLLTLGALGLKDQIDANVAFDLKKNILATTLNLEGKSMKEVEDLYTKLVKKSYVVNTKGEEDKKVTPDKISFDFLKEQFKAKDRLLPVYEVADISKPNEVKYYVFPMFGFGLWDSIWGYVALESDMNTIKGIVFGQKGETSGLGARISEAEIQDRYKGKKMFEGENLATVEMQKGEGNDYSKDAHKIDGMSGATITGKGVNTMLKDYFTNYTTFIKSKKAK
jgi:Na+-transporting NADH:ubiquinone oxidoreductase subunit C